MQYLPQDWKCIRRSVPAIHSFHHIKTNRSIHCITQAKSTNPGSKTKAKDRLNPTISKPQTTVAKIPEFRVISNYITQTIPTWNPNSESKLKGKKLIRSMNIGKW
ncbi:hypothetical protein Droror1_Dr00026070 [Drosera rotundifolia]